MSSELATRVRNELARFLNDELSTNDFQLWLVPETWDVGPDHEDADLVHEIELRIIEKGNGDWTLDELKALLRPLVDDSPQARKRAAEIWQPIPSERQVV